MLTLRKLLSLFVCLTLIIMPVQGWALPAGQDVTAGTATFDWSHPGQLWITQGTNKSIINYQSFNVGSGEVVLFLQPNGGITLNRVVGGGSSFINGSLSAPMGSIFLINQDGILFGPSARVKSNGFLASTLDISDSDFLNGNYNFRGTGGKVVNQGEIAIVPGGYVALLGSVVKNEGTILADLGKVALASGQAMTVNLDAGGIISAVVDVTEAAENNESSAEAVSNTGIITSNGGQVVLTAQALDGIFTNVVNNSGVIVANELSSINGEVYLGSSHDIQLGGTVDVTGNVTAEAGTDIVVNNNADITTQGGNFQASAGNDFVMRLDSSIDTDEGIIDIYANNDVILGKNNFEYEPSFFDLSEYEEENLDIISDSDVFLTAENGKILQYAGKIKAENLMLTADKGIGDPWMLVDAQSISAVNYTEGDIRIFNSNEEEIELEYYSTPFVSIENLSGHFGLNEDSQGYDGIQNYAFGGEINLQTETDLGINATVSSEAGDIFLEADGNIIQNEGGNVYINNSPSSTYSITNLASSSHSADDPSNDNTVDMSWELDVDNGDVGNYYASASGDYIMSPDSSVETNGGDITIEAENDIALSLLDAQTGNVNVYSEEGSILDADGSTVADDDYDVIGQKIILTADNGTVGEVEEDEEGEGAIDVGYASDRFVFSALWDEMNDSEADGSEADFTASLNSSGDWVFSSTSEDLSDSDSWWFHVAATDGEELLSETEHSGPYFIDTTAPVITSLITGTPGTVSGTWYPNVNVAFTATDNLSGFESEGSLTENLGSNTTSGVGTFTFGSGVITDRAGNVAIPVSTTVNVVDNLVPPQPPVPPTINPDFFYEDLFKNIKIYYEILSPNQLLSFANNINPVGVYAYHPLTSTDTSAFDSIRLDVEAYDFIDGNINLKNELNSFYQVIEEKKD